MLVEVILIPVAGIAKIIIGKHQILLVEPHHLVGTNRLWGRGKVLAQLMLGVKHRQAPGARQRMEMIKGVGNCTIKVRC